MKHRLLKTLTSLVLVALMVVSLMPAIAITTSAAEGVTYTFSNYEAGTQYAENEVHVLDDNLTVTTTQAHFTTQLRLYSSSSHDGYAIFEASTPISSMVINAGHKADTLNVYTSTDGSTWTLAEAVSVTTSYTDYTVNFSESTSYIKFDVEGTQQVRIAYVVVTYDAPSGSIHTHDYAWNGVVGTDGNHTLQCTNSDNLCETLTKTEACKWNDGVVTSDPDCSAEGEKTFTCTVCGATKTEPVEMTDHNYVDGFCADCGAEEPEAPSYGNLVADFQFGDNSSSASHNDGTKLSTDTDYTSGTYTLTITSLTNVYGSAFDAKGNSAIKLGTSSAVASFSFTVPADVTTVVINIAGYKARTSKISVNGGDAYTLTTSSDNGEYEAITVDTSTNKTVTLSTVSGSTRCMIDSIAFYIPAGDASCTHTNTEEIPAVTPGCTTVGATAGVKCSDCGFIVTAPEAIPATGHTIVDGTCTVCGTKIHYTIPEALEAADGTAVVVTGTVYLINEAWSSYNNMSVTIKDAQGNELYLYRLSTQVAVGDIITVTGVMATYNSNRQIAAGATATIDDHEEIEVVYDEVTISEAIASDDGRLVTFSGTVTNIAQAWTGSYTNVTVADAEGNSIYLYKLATEVALGDIITVKGIVGSYSGNKQIVSATAEVTGYAEPSLDGFAISLNKGITVKVTYTLSAGWVNNNPNAKVVFSNGTECDVVAGTNVYSTNLTPGQINDALTVAFNGTTEDVSFAAYKTKAEAASETKLGLSDTKYEALIALLGEIQDYANAADGNGNETDNLDSVTGISKTDDNGIFANISASLGDTASLKIGMSGDVTGYTVVVTLGGKEILNGNLSSYININGLYPVHFNDEIVITISNGTETVASATFTFNSCLKALYEYAGSSDAVKQMAVATYNYGVAVEAYTSAE